MFQACRNLSCPGRFLKTHLNFSCYLIKAASFILEYSILDYRLRYDHCFGVVLKLGVRNCYWVIVFLF